MLVTGLLSSVIPPVIIGTQTLVWLKSGVWYPATLTAFGFYPPVTTWLGFNDLLWRIFDGYSVALLSFIIGTVLFVILANQPNR